MSQSSEKSINSKEPSPAPSAFKSTNPKKSNLKPFTYFLGFFVSAACLVWVFGKLDWNNFLKEVVQMNPLFLIFGLVLTLTHNFVMGGRWFFILKKLGKVKFWTAYWSLRISYFFNATLPARLGEPFRILYIKKFTKISVGRSIGAMAADRLLDFLSLVLILYLSAFVLGVRGSLPTMKTLAVISALSIILIILIGRLPEKHHVRWIHAILQFRLRLYEGISPLKDIRVLSLCLPLSFLGWLLNALIILGLAFALDEPISIFKAFLVCAGVVVAISIPSSPGNFGTFELAAIGVLKYFGVPYEKAVAIAILYHMILLLPTLAIGAFGYHFRFLRSGDSSLISKDKLLQQLERTSEKIDPPLYGGK